jgi:hypothetical protein
VCRFWWGNLKERDCLEDADGRITLKCILKKEDEGMNRICVAQDGTVTLQNIVDYSLTQ